MIEPTMEQICSFRLHSHHLDGEYFAAFRGGDPGAAAEALAGACGMQNTPPGAWESALFNRFPSLTLAEMENYLYKEKRLLQTWSFRGAPVVFPLSERETFLSALIPRDDEPWIYTNGIRLALDFLEMSFDEVFYILKQVLPRLDETVLVSKTELDQTLARWMEPLLPAGTRARWNAPSMYGSPDKQTVGGAAVSFLLRPAAFLGLVVFGDRRGGSPAFTSCRNWMKDAGCQSTSADIGAFSSAADGTGETDVFSAAAQTLEDAGKRLARKFLHCYGPATADAFASWLGCSGKQARRIWASISEEMEPVTVLGKKSFILSTDRERLFSPALFPRKLLLLDGHDPFLDQRDRLILQPDKTLHKKIWRTVSNPGVILWCGEAVGIWNSRAKGSKLEITAELWDDCLKRKNTGEVTGISQETANAEDIKKEIRELAERYALFRQKTHFDITL